MPAVMDRVRSLFGYAKPKPQRPRNVRARYDAAQTTDENRRHWANADSFGPDAALDPGVRRILRTRARYEVNNDTYANGMVSTLANDTIGTGPSLQMLSGNKAVDSEIELKFWEWTQSIGLPRKLRTMRRAKAVDGEAFGSFFTNRQLRHPVRLDFRLHEAEMIASPFGGYDINDQADGVVLDDFGNVIAYTLLKEHPGEALSGSWDYVTVRAGDMIHLFNADRPAQHRGAPEITPALPLFALRRRYALAVLRAAENAALFSWFLKSQAAPFVTDDETEPEPLETLDFERGQGMVLPKGWEAHQMKAEHPTSQYEMFTQAIIREIARCLNMPYNVAAGDSSSYNYASGRMDHQVYHKALRVERAYVESTALDVILNHWWDEALLVPGYLPAEVLQFTTPPLHEWRWDGHEHVDPLKEANAQAVRLTNHTTTLADEYARKGQDWEDQLRQRAKELQLMNELGIGVVQQTASQDEGDDDES